MRLSSDWEIFAIVSPLLCVFVSLTKRQFSHVIPGHLCPFSMWNSNETIQSLIFNRKFPLHLHHTKVIRSGMHLTHFTSKLGVFAFVKLYTEWIEIPSIFISTQNTNEPLVKNNERLCYYLLLFRIRYEFLKSCWYKHVLGFHWHSSQKNLSMVGDVNAMKMTNTNSYQIACLQSDWNYLCDSFQTNIFT